MLELRCNVMRCGFFLVEEAHNYHEQSADIPVLYILVAHSYPYLPKDL